jgi:hypothetical protein
MMSIVYQPSRKLKIIRWVARIWTIPVVILALIAVLNPNPGATGEEVPWLSSFFLIMYAIAVLGLVIGWRWELVGGLLTIVTLVMRDTLYLIMLGNWVENLIFVWIPLVPPAVLFLLAWRMEKIAKGQWGR